MSPTTVVIITLGINIACVIIGFIASYITLSTTWFDKNRIQVDKKVPMKTFYQRLPLIGFNLALLLVLAGSGVYTAFPMFDLSGFYWGTFFLQFFIFLLLDDLFFYWFHRLMHENEYLFRKIHRIHHRATSPFPLEFLYVHPLEWMLGTIGIVAALFAIYFGFGSINIYAFWFYVFYRSAHEIEIHSGIDGITRFIPFYGTVRQHDDHHAYIKGNYASSLSYLDKIFGTYVGKK
jgi:sterol desaturase/sphingolipid hydroxylase (fatty acid hydroxylase superfamily)